MSEFDKNKVFGINIIKGENTPEDNMLSVNVYSTGAIRTLLYQTSVKSGPNPEWYSNAFFIHPVRGLHLHFEMVSYIKHQNEWTVIAIGDFDPRIQNIRNFNNSQNQQQASTISINMCVLKNNSIKTDQITNLYIRVHYMPMNNFLSQALLAVQSNPVISSPFYITLDPISPINQISSKQGNFRFPYELSAILLNEKQEIYEVINSGNPIFKGCNHSGSNICSTFLSLTQAIRFDPVLLNEASIRYILIVVTSINYLPLKQIFESGEKDPIHASITAWSTAENLGQNFPTKQNRLNLTSLPNQEIRISGQFPLVCQNDSTVAVVAVGKISTSITQNEHKKHHSRTNSKVTVSFNPLVGQFPSKDAQISPQDPTSIVPIIVQMSDYTKDKSSLSINYAESSQTPKNKAHFPLLVPRSLSEAFNIRENPVITAKCSLLSSFNSNHIFFATALDIQYNSLFTCSKKSKYPVESYLKRINKGSSLFNFNSFFNKNSVELIAMKDSFICDDRQNIQVTLKDLPEDVFAIFFGIYGKKPLSSDRPSPKSNKGKKKDNDFNNDNLDNNLIAYSNNDAILFDTPYNFSRTKNSLIWFALYRDAFGGWGILNIRKSYSSIDEDNLRLIFVDTMKEILKF